MLSLRNIYLKVRECPSQLPKSFILVSTDGDLLINHQILELKEDKGFKTLHTQCIHLHLYIRAYRVYISFHSFTISGISSSVGCRKWEEGPKNVAHLLSVIRGQPHLYPCALCLKFTVFY